MEGTGPIDVFKSTNYKEGTGWANTNASSDYDRIQEKYTRSYAESGGDSSAVDEIACMERALGHRRGHIRGVGRVSYEILFHFRQNGLIRNPFSRSHTPKQPRPLVDLFREIRLAQILINHRFLNQLPHLRRHSVKRCRLFRLVELSGIDSCSRSLYVSAAVEFLHRLDLSAGA
ncbi:hypothetical protein L1987_75773 [Smallanthus sonchifolius]|uniref:Uncharacterized protein n=1 Tax=Smallanthus sonchifolius TaxID=185202 RepID=A0ACB9A7E0_9ASTR|nr:hypothetical protein L1987_75773 [Smallanthus sonchifolius]